jgi:hypothetical protein
VFCHFNFNGICYEFYHIAQPHLKSARTEVKRNKVYHISQPDFYYKKKRKKEKGSSNLVVGLSVQPFLQCCHFRHSLLQGSIVPRDARVKVVLHRHLVALCGTSCAVREGARVESDVA